MKAAGSSELLDSESEKVDLECSICCHDYNWTDKCPRELECLHTFCTECLTKMEGQLPNAGRHISCPLCRHSTELTASGALGLPRQEEILSEILSLQPGEHGGSSATLSQQLILTLDSGETTVIMLPTVSLSVERGDGQRASRAWNLREHSLVRQNQKQQAAVCLRKASWRVATLLILFCIAAFVLGPRLF
ncbi:RING finger domain-containing protein [Chiloscyllium plagiosum]|uniref:RING finger domain-containing protein n=1 Tax=Chiloscyllium plagiosum TaxID=36176 RepID=UPI001CB7E720|nr:RING finger domain-containing protein [Chiloscyllium plagiosum]